MIEYFVLIISIIFYALQIDVCQNNDARCGANPGWPYFWCDRDYVYERCHLLCGRCNGKLSKALMQMVKGGSPY